MKNKFFVEKSAFGVTVGLTIFFIFLMTAVLLIYPKDSVDYKITLYSTITFVIFILPVLLAGVAGTVCFEDSELIFKRTAFHRKQHLSYEDIEKITLEFYNHSSGKRIGNSGPLVLIYVKRRKTAKFIAEIQYEMIRHLIGKKPLCCQVKIEFYSLRIFSKKYRELLTDYLNGRQKEEIERLIAQKEAKQKKRVNK